MDEFKLLRRIIKSINHAFRIFEDRGMDPENEWCLKYERIYSLHIWQDIEYSGLIFDFNDPDDDYKTDITAYINALRDFLPKVQEALEVELNAKV